MSMARLCKISGGVLLAIGIAAIAIFGILIVRDEDYSRAALVHSRNPGNVMYEAEFRGVQIVRAFQTAGLVAGSLLAANGATLLALGVVADRKEDRVD